MLPIALIHGYSSEGDDNTVEQIYGPLPHDLRAEFGADAVVEVNLARWISLSDGISIDDISFALDRALHSEEYRSLLEGHFHVVTHSTGALVVRNWLRLFSPLPAPIDNLVHLAGANFGSGLAHVGRGQLARWARLLQGVGRGMKVLDGLELGSSTTLDLHGHFLTPGYDMYDDYEVQEFGLIGSQTLTPLRVVPIRYVKEDSADNTVRTSASNLNFNYIRITPHEDALRISRTMLAALHEERLEGSRLSEGQYDVDLGMLASSRREIPFTVLYETAHFGSDIGIVDGEKNRARVLPHLFRALSTPRDEDAYRAVVDAFRSNTDATLTRVAGLKGSLTDWDKQEQYEAHTQVVFRIRDQYGLDVAHNDITFKSRGVGTNQLEKMIEDVHKNKANPGTLTFYLRTQAFDSDHGFVNLLEDCKAVDIEITAEEPDSDDIQYVPLSIELKRSAVPDVLQNFRTTVVDITMLRLPSPRVFALTRFGV
jgi:hypothetical protein